MMNWKKERPLIGTEGLIKGLYSTSNTDYCNTDCWFIQSDNDSMSDGGLNG